MNAVGQQPLVGGVGTLHVRRLRRPVHEPFLRKQRRKERQARMVAACRGTWTGSIMDVPIGLVGNVAQAPQARKRRS